MDYYLVKILLVQIHPTGEGVKNLIPVGATCHLKPNTEVEIKRPPTNDKRYVSVTVSEFKHVGNLLF